MMRRVCWMVSAWIMLSATAASADNQDFDVQFDDCAEYVGIGLVPSAPARSLVPSRYALATVNGSAVIVVRVVTCGSVEVDGGNPRAARTAQIGIMLDGVDEAADIDNYLLWYVTDSGQLHGKLSAAGIKSGNDQQLSFTFAPQGGSGPLSADIDAETPAYAIDGQATLPVLPAVPFVASWWFDGKHGTVRMHSDFPAIRFGSATVTLTTAANTELAQLIGGTSQTFALLDSYNTFESALMEVRIQ